VRGAPPQADVHPVPWGQVRVGVGEAAQAFMVGRHGTYYLGARLQRLPSAGRRMVAAAAELAHRTGSAMSRVRACAGAAGKLSRLAPAAGRDVVAPGSQSASGGGVT
jgi:hypothetical protein